MNLRNRRPRVPLPPHYRSVLISAVLLLPLCSSGQYTGGPGTGHAQVTLTAPTNIQVSLKVFLEGAYDASIGLMSDDLRNASLLPTTEPYTGLAYTFMGGGGETTSAVVLAVTGSDAIVDWVVAELRSSANPSVILVSTSALVQSDGDVVAVDGVSPISFLQAEGNYHIALRHRNHLGVMTLNPVVLSNAPSTVDFTSVATGTFGTDALKSIAGDFPAQVLWSGDVNFDHTVRYTGSANDRDPILVAVGSTTPNNVLTLSYSTHDVNMNGQVSYTGSANDRDPILVNVGSTTPNNVRAEQLP